MPFTVLPVLQFPIYSKLESEQTLIFFKVSGPRAAKNEGVSPRGEETSIFSKQASFLVSPYRNTLIVLIGHAK